MKPLTLALCTLACTLSLGAQAAAEDPLKPFPAATEGYQRYVIELPETENEADLKVEIIGGKNQMVDCNVQRLGGQWQEKTVEGWGYTYFELSHVGPAMSTLMACPDQAKHEAFVRAGGEPYLVRYNSKLPLVVYTPNDIEVRYRLWKAEPDMQVAPAR